MDLEFREKLTTYGITQEEYEAMDPKEKDKVNKQINRELKAEKTAAVGKGISSVGCLIVLIPIAIILIVIIWNILF